MYKKHAFQIPDGVIYLDGNSLGPLPKNLNAEMNRVLHDEWGDMLITAWNRAGWMDLPSKVGNMIAPIVGAAPNTITMGDTLSIKMVQALHAAIQFRPERKIVLTDSGNFPTDIYMAQGLLSALGGYELKIVQHDEIEAAIDESISAIMLTHVDYRTGKMHNMNALTEKAHANGAIAIWDLAHSAGAVHLELEADNVDFAAGCTYKYLNGGPGAPAFIYVRPDLIDKVSPILSGWMGHEAPFNFDLDYRPTSGIERMRVGTPPILQLRALENALELFQGIDMQEIREKSVKLTQLFVDLVDHIPDLELSTPRESTFRGSQISYAHPKSYEIMQALIDRGVIGDFRAPNLMRFGITPLYINEGDIENAVKTLSEIMESRAYEEPKYAMRSKVT